MLDSIARDVVRDAAFAAKVRALWSAENFAAKEQALAVREGVKSRKSVEQVLKPA